MEEWRPIKGYEGIYEVSNLGNIRSLDRYMYSKRWNGNRLIKGHILKPTKSHNGYLRIELTDKEDERKKHPVHRLVAQAFIDNPNNLPQINHKDEIRDNNNADNLEWCDAKYNVNYGHCIEKHFVKVNQYTLDGVFIKTYNSLTEASKEGFNLSCISNCINNRLNSHKGYLWRYK